MFRYPPDAYGPVIASLLPEPRLNPLGPGISNATMRDALRTFSFADAVAPCKVSDRSMAMCCHAALWLHHNFLDDSHTLSQEIHTSTGSYWHGIMHRREPDASNAAYWFRRVGQHPVYAQLAADARALGLSLPSDGWDALAFIDACERHRGSDDDTEMLLRQVQQREWELLFDWCFAHAVKPG